MTLPDPNRHKIRKGRKHYHARVEAAAPTIHEGSGQDWRDKAPCASLPTSWFFPDDMAGGFQLQAAETAIVVCGTCPVFLECEKMAWGDHYDKPSDGIFAGRIAQATETYLSRHTPVQTEVDISTLELIGHLSDGKSIESMVRTGDYGTSYDVRERLRKAGYKKKRPPHGTLARAWQESRELGKRCLACKNAYAAASRKSYRKVRSIQITSVVENRS